jgi:hypothetical protein
MPIDIKFTENKNKNKILSVPCVTCKTKTNHKVITSFDKDGCEYNLNEQWSVTWTESYQIIQCQGCDSVSFRHMSWFSEDVDPISRDNGETEQLYPNRHNNYLTVKSFYNVPSNLRRIYEETIDCFNNESSVLCASGLRAIVDGICVQQGVLEGPVQTGDTVKHKDNLKGRIAGLQEKGILTQNNAQTLHEHRCMGSAAVHELARPSVDELRLAIEIIEHILEQLYEIPEKAIELKRAVACRKI